MTPANPQAQRPRLPLARWLLQQLAICEGAPSGDVERQTQVVQQGSGALKLAAGLAVEARAVLVSGEFAPSDVLHAWIRSSLTEGAASRDTA